MAACLADVEDREKGSCLSGRGENGSHAAFQIGDSGCHRVVGGILKSGIEISGCLQVKELSHFIGGIVLECGGLVNGDLSRLPVSRVPAGVDTFCFDAVISVHECSSS